jgi:hypothetical protein
MAGKRKGRLNLLDALLFLEATVSRGYPDDGTGIAGDDDRPPGNIVYGEKYKKQPYFNKLTDYQEHWKVDHGKWKWDEFEYSMGMEDIENYSNTIRSMRDLFPKDTWDNMWKRMKHVPDALTTLRFKQAGQPWRKGGKDQLGVDKETHVDIDVDKGGSFKDAEVENESLEDRINNLTL